jgi:ferredoxin
MNSAEALATCGACPSLCEAVCPVSPLDRNATPWGKMRLAALLADGRLAPARRDWLAWCTHCGACMDACAHHVPVAGVIAGALAARGGPAMLAEALDPSTVLASWQSLGALQGGAVVLIGNVAARDLDVPALRAALAARSFSAVPVLVGLDTGASWAMTGKLAEWHALGREIDLALGGVEVIAVATGDDLRMLRAHQQEGRLCRSYVTLLDQWLGRFGAPVPPGALRLTSCQARHSASGTPQTHEASSWPPAPACCGAADPLRSVAPDAARAAARALVHDFARRGIRSVHAPDLQCAAWLRQAIAAERLELAVVDRVTLVTATAGR